MLRYIIYRLLAMIPSLLLVSIMVFSLLLGSGLLLTPGRPARQLEETLQGLYEVVMRLLDVVIRTAPPLQPE